MFENLTDYYYFVIIPMQYAIIGIVIAWVMYQDIQPKALILKKQNETYYRLATINVKKNQDNFIYDKKIYMLDWKKIAYHTQCYWHHVPRFFYLENELTPLDIHSRITEPKSQEALMRKLYMIAKEKVIHQLVKASGSTVGGWGLIIIFIVLSIAVGFGIGWITNTYLNPQQIATKTG